VNRITWVGDRFECSSPELEEAKWTAIHNNVKELHAFVLRCDFNFYGYTFGLEKDVFIIHSDGNGRLISNPIAEEGTGFNTCFHLGAYAIASKTLGQQLEIDALSFWGALHPLLVKYLAKWFGDRSVKDVDVNCPYFSGSIDLKCAVNPCMPCKDCSDVSAGFNEDLFVWKGMPSSHGEALSEYLKSIEDVIMRGGGFQGVVRAMQSVGDTLRGTSNIRIPHIAPPSVSFHVNFDDSRVQGAIARLREAGIQRPFVAVDRSSEEDSTAIATAFTNPDGSIRIEILELHANTYEEAEIEIARVQSTIRSIYDRGQRRPYEWGLDNGITPMLQNIWESHESAADIMRRTLASHMCGMAVPPQPHVEPPHQELHGVEEIND
jgi:hypothetical protein